MISCEPRPYIVTDEDREDDRLDHEQLERDFDTIEDGLYHTLQNIMPYQCTDAHHQIAKAVSDAVEHPGTVCTLMLVGPSQSGKSMTCHALKWGLLVDGDQCEAVNVREIVNNETEIGNIMGYRDAPVTLSIAARLDAAAVGDPPIILFFVDDVHLAPELLFSLDTLFHYGSLGALNGAHFTLSEKTTLIIVLTSTHHLLVSPTVKVVSYPLTYYRNAKRIDTLLNDMDTPSYIQSLEVAIRDYILRELKSNDIPTVFADFTKQTLCINFGLPNGTSLVMRLPINTCREAGFEEAFESQLMSTFISYKSRGLGHITHLRKADWDDFVFLLSRCKPAYEEIHHLLRVLLRYETIAPTQEYSATNPLTLFNKKVDTYHHALSRGNCQLFVQALLRGLETELSKHCEYHMDYFDLLQEIDRETLLFYRLNASFLLLLRGDDKPLFHEKLTYDREKRIYYYLHHKRHSFRNLLFTFFKERILLTHTLLTEQFPHCLASLVFYQCVCVSVIMNKES